jgi:ribosomal protein S18 acetylase RimI-like enzyme
MTSGGSGPGRADRISTDDVAADFRSGERALDDYFRRHALANDATGIGRAYVLRRRAGDDATLPAVLGFYTVSMAVVVPAAVEGPLRRKLPKYPMPAALIGRLAVDERARGRRIGEALLVDALRRVAGAAEVLGCIGVIVDAKNEAAEGFYTRYGFVVVAATSWPHRLFLPMSAAHDALGRRA